MADVAQLESLNKMNAQNIAMVFTPNMTQMSDPLTALIYAVHVLNFLKTLIVITLREREGSMVDPSHQFNLKPSDDNEDCSSLQPVTKGANKINEESQDCPFKEAFSKCPQTPRRAQDDLETERENLAPTENLIPCEDVHFAENCIGKAGTIVEGGKRGAQPKCRRFKIGQTSKSNCKSGSKNAECTIVHVARYVNSRSGLVQTWR